VVARWFSDSGVTLSRVSIRMCDNLWVLPSWYMVIPLWVGAVSTGDGHIHCEGREKVSSVQQ